MRQIVPSLALVAAVGLLVAGCQTDQTPAPALALAPGAPPVPTFARSAVTCDPKPLPPDPRTHAKGSADVAHQGDLEAWGQRCANKMGAVRRRLEDSGQVVNATAK